jgi:hypothetical protein
LTLRASLALWIALAIMASLAVWPDAGIGQDRGRSASPDELWQDYPLQQDEKAGGGAGNDRAPGDAQAGGTRQAPERPGDAWSSSSDEGSGDDGATADIVLVVGLIVVPLVFLLAILVPFQARRRSGRPRPETVAPDSPTAVLRDRRVSGPTWADLRASAWTAEIQWRGDKGAARFRVVASPPGGKDEVSLLESRQLDWPPASDAAVESLVGAVADLERSLVAAGWEVTEPGASWFARRFRWPRSDRAPDLMLQTARAARGA